MKHSYKIQTEAGVVTLQLGSGTRAIVTLAGSISGRLQLERMGWVPDRFDVFVPGTNRPAMALTRSIVMKAVLKALDTWALLNQDALIQAEIDSCDFRLEMSAMSGGEDQQRLRARVAKCRRALRHGTCSRS